MGAIPEHIDDHENLAHALFKNDDVTRSPFWVHARALIPPKSYPHEVSFNRACYLPDVFQKQLAKSVMRAGKTFTGFVLLKPIGLKSAIKLVEADYNKKGERFSMKVDFRYTPIYNKITDEPWPIAVEKVYGNGFNPSHADLYFEEPVKKGEVNIHHTALARVIVFKDNDLYKFVVEKEEYLEHPDWKGEDLC